MKSTLLITTLKSHIFLLTFSVLSFHILQGQDIIWDFGTSVGNASPSTTAPMGMTSVPIVVQGNNNGTTTMLTTTSPSNNSGASAGYNAGAAARVGALNTGASGSAYFEFTLTPDAGYIFTLTSYAFNSRSTSTGPQAYSIRTSLDAYASDVATSTMTNNSTWTNFPNTGLSVVSGSGTPVTFRLYGYNGTGSPAVNTANWRIDDVNLGLTIALPVGLTSFDAKIVTNEAQLSFSTASERNNDYFAIERSNDGQSFHEIGQVKGAGTTSYEQNYSFIDAHPFNGTNYYRLRQVDFDGKTTYSRVVTVVFGKNGNITMAPSPASDRVRIQLDQPASEDAAWQVFDVAGRLIQSGVWQAENTFLNLDVNTLSEGIYTFRLTTGAQMATKKFWKQ